jgi:hypothetical protein
MIVSYIIMFIFYFHCIVLQLKYGTIKRDSFNIYRQTIIIGKNSWKHKLHALLLKKKQNITEVFFEYVIVKLQYIF